jgi:hypothetical protein
MLRYRDVILVTFNNPKDPKDKSLCIHPQNSKEGKALVDPFKEALDHCSIN